MYTSEADFNKPGIYGGSVRVWATACDVFRRAQPRVGRGGRTAEDFVVCFGLGGFLMRPFFAHRQKKNVSYRGAYRVPLFDWSVRLSVCVCQCVTVIVFTECESCTRPISTNSGLLEAGKYGPVSYTHLTLPTICSV